MKRQYGLKFDEQKPEDYVFGGGFVPFECLQPDGDWSEHLPVKEFQNLQNIEPYACVSFTILNCIEILIKRQYGEERNYSDRFLAAISGTKEGGNTPKTVCEFLRKVGIVPQDLWPFDYSVTSFEKFYEPVPPKLYELAKEFNDEFIFKYEIVPSNHEAISKALQSSPLLFSVCGWHKNADGLYYRPNGMDDNHATTLISTPQNRFKRVFDTYADGDTDPALKDLIWGDLPKIAFRFYVKKRITPIKGNWFTNLIRGLFYGEF